MKTTDKVIQVPGAPLTPTFTTPHITLYTGDVMDVLRRLPDESVDCVVTSPPYWGLRDYGVPGQIGLERTPAEYVAVMVGVFRELRRIARASATVWLNLGDSYHSGDRGGYRNDSHRWESSPMQATTKGTHMESVSPNRLPQEGLKDKDLVGIPWRVAFALQADGWFLRSDIVWSKPNPMPESVLDRPTKAHEYIFLLTKSKRYFYDAAAIRTEPAPSSIVRLAQNVDQQEGSWRANGGAKTNGPMKAVARKTDKQRGHGRRHAGFNDRWDGMERAEQIADGANAKTVWTIATMPYPDAHFATFPREIPERCIKAGCPPDGTVLDPFAGSGTTLAVARDLGRKSIGIELNPAYVGLIEKRCAQLALEMGA